MRIVIRLKTGRRLGPDPRARAAHQLSIWFGQIAAFGYLMTVWKYGFDLDAAERFAFREGWLSHWQSWGALSLVAQWLGFRLRKSADAARARRVLQMPERVTAPVTAPVAPSSPRPFRSAPSIRYRAG